MALLFADGLDPYTSIANMQASRWGGPFYAYNNQYTIQLAPNGGPFGTQALQLNGWSGTAGNVYGGLYTAPIPGLSLANTLNFSLWVLIPTGMAFNMLTANLGQLLPIPNSVTAVGSCLGLNTSGQLCVFNPTDTSGTALAAGPALAAGVWHHIELSAVFSTTVGAYVLRVDGLPALNISGINNWASGATLLGKLGLSGASGTNNNSGYLMSFDDFIVWDNTGSAFNTFPRGPKRITTLNPTGAGSSTQFTPSNGSNYSVAAQAWGGSSTLTATASGQTDLYTTAGIAYSPSVVDGVLVTALANNPAGDASVNLTPKIQTQSVQSGGATTLGIATAEASALFLLDATGNPLTPSTINSMQIGFGD